MILQMRQWMQKFDALSQRERLLIVAALLVLLYGLADALFFQPWRVQHKQLNQQLKDGQMQIGAVSDAIAARMRLIQVDPDRANRQRLQELQRETAKIQQEMRQRQQTLIMAQQMPQLLQALMQRHPKVYLRTFKTLQAQVVYGASTPVVAEGSAGSVNTANPNTSNASSGNASASQVEATASPVPANNASAAQKVVTAIAKGQAENAAQPAKSETSANTPRLYKHEVELELVGNYLDILTWLQELEKSPWKLYWGQTSLRTDKYPQSVLVLRVYTLSMDQAWLDL